MIPNLRRNRYSEGHLIDSLRSDVSLPEQVGVGDVVAQPRISFLSSIAHGTQIEDVYLSSRRKKPRSQERKQSYY